jgi:hypothetical protein
MRPRNTLCWIIAASGLTVAAPVAGQGTPSPVQCNGQRVSEIVVYASAPTVAGAQRVPILRDVVRTMHMTTDPSLTRNYLHLHEGSACTELRRTESERVLRAQPFIADASVLAYDDSAGGVRLEVSTIDEASLLAALRMSGDRPFLGRLRLGNANLMGQGLLLSGQWRTGGPHRDGYALSLAKHQLMGRPWVMALDMRRDPMGGNWNAHVSRPFLTDLQRDAWRVHGGDATEFVRLDRAGDVTRVLPVTRSFADVGVLTRIGPPRRLGLLGVSLSHERERTGSELVVVDEFGSRSDSTAMPTSGQYASHTMARVNVLSGVRLLDFVPVRGFDGLSATQDFPIGLQAGMVVGRSTPTLGAIDDDWFTSLDLYAGWGNASRATRFQLAGEGRFDRSSDRWDGIAMSGSVAHYAKAGLHNTTILSADWAAGWHPRVPGRLELGAVNGGLRGFGGSQDGGGRRAVFRIEQRRVIGRINGTAEFGAALFADAGRVWAGESPFGVTTPWRGAIGASILAALPVRSARLWRLDVAMPSTGGGPRRWEVRVSRTGPYTPSTDQFTPVDGMRSRAVPTSVFLWP